MSPGRGVPAARDSALPEPATCRAPAPPVPRAPVAYVTGWYPMVAHTFILREVAALRALGVEVVPCSIHRPGAEEVRGFEAQAELARTFVVMDVARNPLRLLGAHLRLAAAAPRRWAAAAGLAWRLRPPGMRALLWQGFYLAEAGVLAAHLRQRGVGHLHNHLGDSSGTVALLAATMAGVTFSFTAHGPDLFFAPAHWRLDEKTARARFVACISQYCRSRMMLFSDPAHWSRLAVVRCGIEPERYAGTDTAAQEGTGRRILFVGRLARVKGVQLLLEAVAGLRARFPDTSLTLIGDGPERTVLETRAAELGLGDTVRFEGYRSEQEVAAALAVHDMLVLPSFAEGLPVVLMEALASGVPVIATHVAGVPELVRDGETGLLVPPGDAEALAEAIGRLLADPALGRRMGAAGRARVLQDHDIRREAAKLAALFAGRV